MPMSPPLKLGRIAAATAGMLEYPDLPRAEVDALEEELFDVIGIDNLIEIEKRTVEKEWATCWITDACHLTPDKSILGDLRR